MKPPLWLRRIARRMARPPLAQVVVTIHTLPDLMQAMGWTRIPQFDPNPYATYATIEDANQRRLRDAEVIAAACANAPGNCLLEIGTAHGDTTALMAEQAPHAIVHTVNIPPEEIARGGTFTTFAPGREAIGRVWRERKLTNVRQVFANTATWKPDIDALDLAFIDGCHDTDFVINDTELVLARCKSGSLILWHDFHPGLCERFAWIRSVCAGVECLVDRGRLPGPIFHLADSWIGLYRVPK